MWKGNTLGFYQGTRMIEKKKEKQVKPVFDKLEHVERLHKIDKGRETLKEILPKLEVGLTGKCQLKFNFKSFKS